MKQLLKAILAVILGFWLVSFVISVTIAIIAFTVKVVFGILSVLFSLLIFVASIVLVALIISFISTLIDKTTKPKDVIRISEN